MRSALLATTAVAAAAAPGAVSITQSTAAGERWADKGTVAWGPDFASTVYVTVDRARAYQTVLGWGGALTDTSAINWLMMNATSQARFMAAYWGDVSKGALGYNVHRVAINSPDYAAVTFNYDAVSDDFALAHFDANLTYDREHVVPLIHAVKVRRAALRASGRSAGRWHARPRRAVARPPHTTHVRPWPAPMPSLTLVCVAHPLAASSAMRAGVLPGAAHPVRVAVEPARVDEGQRRHDLLLHAVCVACMRACVRGAHAAHVARTRSEPRQRVPAALTSHVARALAPTAPHCRLCRPQARLPVRLVRARVGKLHRQVAGRHALGGC